jgi:uncharacterized protein YecT (DUF1311 family)
MKKFIISIITLFSINFTFSQLEVKEVSKDDSLKFEIIIKKSIDSIKLKLSSDDYLNDIDKKTTIEFTIDTFVIAKRFDLYISQDYSDYGMKTASIHMLNEYEKLLNKYYKILLSNIKPEDKEILKTTQRNWIKYRESELKLNFLVSEDKYSGGGTIQILFVLSRNIEITQNRVIEFKEYIDRLNLNKE